MWIKSITQYTCQVCNTVFTDINEATKHEAKCMNLKDKEYQLLEKLEGEEKQSLSSMNFENNETTRNLYDEVVEKVITFRQNHHLPVSEKLHHV